MKKMIFVLVMMVTILSGCTKQTPVIPLIIYNEADPYMYEFAQYIIDKAPSEYTVVSYDSQNSQLIQNEFIEDAFKKNSKVVIINPVDRLGAYTIIEKAKSENIPIIFMNREPLKEDLNLWEHAYYVGAPAAHSAVLQSEIIMDLFGIPLNLNELDRNNDNIIQLIILKGEQGHQDAETRTDVVIEELENHGYALEILSIEICDWKTSLAYDIMNELIPRYQDQLELVISNNDAMAIGAIEAMVEHEMFVDIDENGFIDHETDTWIPVVGIDGIADAVDLIKSGYLFGTVLNDSESMAEAIIELATAIINGEDIHNIGYEIIDNKYIWVDYQKYILEEE
ncbi:MAG: galactose ABC transporter substrate-binding protein [Bacilli bacterium]|nr:galactose ABC transporter substrate-binding protein [Bacilli bacterium]